LAEAIDGSAWRGDPSAWAIRPFETIEYSTLEWVDWFNHRRLLEPIGNIPPAKAEELYSAVLDGACKNINPTQPRDCMNERQLLTVRDSPSKGA
jgi:hypothetical protein